jgi:hypothetical protein
MGVAVVRKLSDESLLAGLGSGDPDAAADFLRRFQRRVFGLTLSILAIAPRRRKRRRRASCAPGGTRPAARAGP